MFGYKYRDIYLFSPRKKCRSINNMNKYEDAAAIRSSSHRINVTRTYGKIVLILISYLNNTLTFTWQFAERVQVYSIKCAIIKVHYTLKRSKFVCVPTLSLFQLRVLPGSKGMKVGNLLTLPVLVNFGSSSADKRYPKLL